jgi:two-component sensor histidine kinase
MMDPVTRYYLVLAGFALVGLAGFFTLYLFKWENQRNFFILALILAGIAWIFASFMEIAANSYDSKVFWYQAQYICLICVPPFWIATAVHMSGMRKDRAQWTIVSTFALAAVFLALFLTNPLHHLAFETLGLAEDGRTVRKAPGPVYYAYLFYVFTSLFVGVTIIAKGAVTAPLNRRRRAITTAVAIGIPIVLGLVDLVFPEFLGSLEIAPIAALPACIVLFIGALKYRFLDPVPVAKADLVERLADPVLVFDVTGALLYANARARSLMSDKSEGAAEKAAKGDSRPPMGEAAAAVRVCVKSAADGAELSLMGKDWAVAAEPVLDDKGDSIARIVSLRDVTSAREAAQRLEEMVAERTVGLAAANRSLADEVEKTRRSEAALKSSLDEKDLLLRELNHRVKNNLQVISSLLRLQSSRAGEKEVRQALESTQGRIRSISLVHERLYRDGSPGKVDAGEYIRAVAGGIAALHKTDARGVDLSVDSGGVELDLDTAVNLGIIVNEAVSNAFKHVFDRGRGSRLGISLRANEAASLILRVEDDGPGFKEGETPAGLGLMIIEAVARQLGGRVEYGGKGSGVLVAEIRPVRAGSEASPPSGAGKGENT